MSQSHLLEVLKKAKENRIVGVAAQTVIPFMNALWFYVVSYVLVTMLLRFALLIKSQQLLVVLPVVMRYKDLDFILSLLLQILE